MQLFSSWFDKPDATGNFGHLAIKLQFSVNQSKFYSGSDIFSQATNAVSCKLETDATTNDIAWIEFSVGMAEGREFDLWLLIKSLSPGQNRKGKRFWTG